MKELFNDGDRKLLLDGMSLHAKVRNVTGLIFKEVSGNQRLEMLAAYLSELQNQGQVIPEPGATLEENILLNVPLPHDLSSADMARVWEQYQAVIGKLLVRMGAEHPMLDSIARMVMVGTLDGVKTRMALLPILGYSALNAVGKHRIGELTHRLAGECCLMELSAAAGYRTFCFPGLVEGLMRSGKMKDRSVHRMFDTFTFLNTMLQYPMGDQHIMQALKRTNGLHRRYKVAGAASPDEQDLFKYIALNMFYIGPSMRPDLTPFERHALCGLTVLVSRMMGHAIKGTVKELEAFIADYEAASMFNLDAEGPLRRAAVEIARASKVALDKIPTISSARIHGYVPYRVKRILELETEGYPSITNQIND